MKEFHLAYCLFKTNLPDLNLVLSSLRHHNKWSGNETYSTMEGGVNFCSLRGGTSGLIYTQRVQLLFSAPNSTSRSTSTSSSLLAGLIFYSKQTNVMSIIPKDFHFKQLRHIWFEPVFRGQNCKPIRFHAWYAIFQSLEYVFYRLGFY